MAVDAALSPAPGARRPQTPNLARTPFWLPGGNLQTIWPALLSSRPSPAAPLQRERWDTPDGDFIDVDAGLAIEPDAPVLVLFHGLEGSSASHYAQGFAAEARSRGWTVVLPHFRGCSGELNRAPRAYHSGDHAEIDWILRRVRARSAKPVLAAGVSLGGNALMRWAGEHGEAAREVVGALASISSPLDLAAAGAAIDRGFNRLAYARMFLASMKPKALRKLEQYPGLFDRARLLAAKTLYAFDDVFTAPLHGFRDTPDYWARASAKPHLAKIRVRALALNARNDPFVPADSLPRPDEVGPLVTLAQPAHGGHCGFPSGRFPGQVRGMPRAVCDWFATE